MHRRHFLAMVIASATLSGCIERQFFYPDPQIRLLPAQLGLQADDVAIPGAEGSKLHGWWLPSTAPGPAYGTVLHLHGNAGNVGVHLPLVGWLPAAGFHLLTIDYRGYGRSPGTPTLDGLVADGAAALAWLRQRRGIDPQRLVVLGQSLGGATAARLVADHPAGVRLLVLDCAFASYRGILRDTAERSWLRWVAPAAAAALPGDDRDPLQAVRRLQVPLLVMHSGDDLVVPLAHGRALYDAAPQPKQWLPLPGLHHVAGLADPAVRQQVAAAMRRAVA